MSRKTVFKEDLELSEIRAAEQELRQRHKEFAELPKRLEQEKRERETTMPPLPEIEDRKRLRDHENTLSRGEAKNILRDQNRSLTLLVMLLAATATLIWWGLTLMEG
jgi:hypothetical protein